MRVPKYRNAKTKALGQTFDSAKEADRFKKLTMLQRAGKVADLRTQVSFELVPTQKRADGKTEVCVRYVADFVYLDSEGRQVVEDVKSAVTRKLPVYVVKRKLMLWRHGITIKEV